MAGMCGRFAAGHLTQAQMLEIVEGFLDQGVVEDEKAPPPRGGYHIRPTNRIALVQRKGEAPVLSSANWQIKDSRTGHAMINAKIENDRYWRKYWEAGRCMIPALGYFEWSPVDGKKEPHFITVRRNAPVMFFAGFVSGDGEGCVILTRAPSPQIAALHSRMPVILAPEDMAGWLGGQMPVAQAQDHLGTQWEGRFAYHRVAPLKQDSEGEAVIEPYSPPQPGFDF